MSHSDWFKQAVVYQILIDRFAGFGSGDWRKPGFLGGNLRGITERFGYLKDLGINTLWLSPFYQTSAYHGYHVTDFMKVEPHFGRREDLGELIEKARNNGMRIIADFVPNHCSRHHRFFLEAQKDKGSRYFKWFTFNKWPNDYLCFLDVGALPKLDLDNPETRDHIVQAAKYWLSMGIDGFRLDHVMGPSHAFWKYFRKEIKSDFPRAVLIGEAWLEGIKYKYLKTLKLKNKYIRWLFSLSQESVQKEYIGELDGVLDFRFLELVRMYIARGRAHGQTRGLGSMLKRHFAAYPGNYFLPTFLDNHDMNRFLFECNNDIEKLKAAAAIQFQLDQPVIIYYGTETGMTHQHPVAVNRPDSDLQARQPMNWQSPNVELFNFYKDMIEKRVQKHRGMNGV